MFTKTLSIRMVGNVPHARSKNTMKLMDCPVQKSNRNPREESGCPVNQEKFWHRQRRTRERSLMWRMNQWNNRLSKNKRKGLLLMTFRPFFVVLIVIRVLKFRKNKSFLTSHTCLYVKRA